MGLQETSDVLITFLQNLVLLIGIPNVNLQWPSVFSTPIEYIQAFVAFDILETAAGVITERAKELDVHVNLVLKNSLLPLFISVLVIVPLQRWYYVVWWAITLSAACGAGILISTLSFFAQQPDEIPFLTTLHSHSYIYDATFIQGQQIGSGQYSPGTSNQDLDLTIVLLLSAAAVVITLSFCCLICAGCSVCCSSWCYRKIKFRRELKRMKKLTPPGKKVNVTKLKFRMVYNEIVSKKESEIQLSVFKFLMRIVPIFCFMIGLVIATAAWMWFKDYMEDDQPDAVLNNVLYTVVIYLVIAGLCCASCCLVCLNSCILCERPRRIIFFFNNLITSKALKLTFLVLSSFYIPLAVSVFSMFDCSKAYCDTGEVFTNRKDDVSATDTFTRLYSQLIRKPTVCTSCQFDLLPGNLTLGNSTADAYYLSAPLQSEVCPGGVRQRLLRSPTIACSDMYPYVGVAGGLCCLFVVLTPILIFYLISLSTRVLNTVNIDHLVYFYRRRIWRRRKNRLEKNFMKRLKKVELENARLVQSYESTIRKMQEHATPELKEEIAKVPYPKLKELPPPPAFGEPKDVKIKNQRDREWEIRIALIDCSVESLYFPFKYRHRYFKLVFLIAKVILAFTNVFGVTLFGQLDPDNSIGPQIVLWTTFVVQFILGILGICIRPHMVFAETCLMVVASASICANCAFGLVLLYSKWSSPAWLTIGFMLANTFILGLAAIMSIVFYCYRLRKNRWKTVQRQMRRLLKRKLINYKPVPSERQRERYMKGLGKKKREPYLPYDIDIPKYAQSLKSAKKYQKAVAYSLNRRSLDTLINFFFFLSVISALAGIFLAMHYIVLFLNPQYVDPYLKTQAPAFKSSLSLGLNQFLDLNTVDRSIPSEALLRNETEAALDKYMSFGMFPRVFCEEAYYYNFAGYANWYDFSRNCTCTRDLDYEEFLKNDPNYESSSLQNVEVEQWRCLNGYVKRRFRKMTIRLVDVNSGRFSISSSNYGDVTLHGYAMRGFCERDFRPPYDMSYWDESLCENYPNLEDFQDKSRSAAWTGFAITPIHNNISKSFMYDGTTIPTGDSTISSQDSQFYRITWDSVKSVLSRRFLS